MQEHYTYTSIDITSLDLREGMVLNHSWLKKIFPDCIPMVVQNTCRINNQKIECISKVSFLCVDNANLVEIITKDPLTQEKHYHKRHKGSNITKGLDYFWLFEDGWYLNDIQYKYYSEGLYHNSLADPHRVPILLDFMQEHKIGTGDFNQLESTIEHKKIYSYFNSYMLIQGNKMYGTTPFVKPNTNENLFLAPESKLEHNGVNVSWYNKDLWCYDNYHTFLNPIDVRADIEHPKKPWYEIKYNSSKETFEVKHYYSGSNESLGEETYTYKCDYERPPLFLIAITTPTYYASNFVLGGQKTGVPQEWVGKEDEAIIDKIFTKGESYTISKKGFSYHGWGSASWFTSYERWWVQFGKGFAGGITFADKIKTKLYILSPDSVKDSPITLNHKGEITSGSGVLVEAPEDFLSKYREDTIDNLVLSLPTTFPSWNRLSNGNDGNGIAWQYCGINIVDGVEFTLQAKRTKWKGAGDINWRDYTPSALINGKSSIYNTNDPYLALLEDGEGVGGSARISLLFNYKIPYGICGIASSGLGSFPYFNGEWMNSSTTGDLDLSKVKLYQDDLDYTAFTTWGSLINKGNTYKDTWYPFPHWFSVEGTRGRYGGLYVLGFNYTLTPYNFWMKEERNQNNPQKVSFRLTNLNNKNVENNILCELAVLLPTYYEEN